MKTHKIAPVNGNSFHSLPALHRGSFIKQYRGPDEDSGIVCFKFWELVVAAGCVYRCSYCFLQAVPSFVFGHYNLMGTIFSNWKQMIEETEKWLEWPTPRMLLIGELQDGLVFDGVYKKYAGQSITEMLIPLFAQQKRHRMIFLTKSVMTQFAKKLPPTDRVVFSWSVNSEEVGKKWEIGTPPPSKRFQAAQEMKELGWPVRFRLDPMVSYDGWESGYAWAIDQINAIGPEMVTIGALRASNTLQAHTARNGRDASIFDKLSEKDPSGFKYRLPFETQVKLFKFAVNRLDRKKIGVALCKEDMSLWKAIGLKFEGCHCLLGKKDEVISERWNGNRTWKQIYSVKT